MDKEDTVGGGTSMRHSLLWALLGGAGAKEMRKKMECRLANPPAPAFVSLQNGAFTDAGVCGKVVVLRGTVTQGVTSPHLRHRQSLSWLCM